MIAIACATTDERAFRAAGATTVETLDEGSSLLLRRHGHETLADPCNEMLDVVGQRADLEAFVLVHQDTVVDFEAHVMARVRGLMAGNGDVAIVGAVAGGPPRELPAVDATLLALSPWAVHNLRFDPAVGGSADATAHDLSRQACVAGRRVLGAPLGLTRLSAPRADRAQRRRELDALTRLSRKWHLEPAGEKAGVAGGDVGS